MQKRELNSWDLAKIIGLMLMAIDHIGIYLYPEDQGWRAIGRAGAPVFIFLIGYADSHRFKWELPILAVILAAGKWYLTGQLFPLNILFTLLLARFALNHYDSRNMTIPRPYEWVFAALVLFPSVLLLEYGTIPMLFALSGYLQNHNYPPMTQKRIWLITLFAYGMEQAFLAQFSPLNAITMAFMILLIGRMLYQLPLIPVMETAPKAGKWLFKTISRYSGYLYVGHLLLLEALRVI